MRQASVAICVMTLAMAALVVVTAGCGTTPLNTRAIEEKYLDEGYANRMYEYGEELLKQGRYQQAYTAFLDAEQTAYTNDLRQAARKRRIWLDDSMTHMEKGGHPLPPKADLGETVEVPEPSLPPKWQAGGAAPQQQILPGIKPGSPSIVIPGPAKAQEYTDLDDSDESFD